MAVTLRQGAIFGSGLVLGAAAAAWMVLASQFPDAPKPPHASSVPARTPAAKPAAGAVAAARQHAACPAQPATRASADGDGRIRLVDGADVPALILAGKEAAAAGRPRDAEVAFLAACRVADKSQGVDSIAAADARYQLGRHYASVAAAGGTGGPELLQRAELLYADSLQTYTARHGAGHERSRFAAEGLAALRQPRAQPQPPAPAAVGARSRPVEALAKPVVPAPAPAPVVANPPPPRQPEPAVAVAPVRPATGQAGPSFDCERARSPSERTICADRELAQLDRNLGRLHARARDAAPDAAAFRRHNDQEWRRRESTCRGDRECLLDWYAHRREQLLDDIGDAR